MLFTLSTNLAIPGIGEKAKKVADMMTKDDFMVISISGLTQEVYEINHKGGKIENVIDNLIVLASTSGYKNNITLRLLQFDYNVGEISHVVELAKKLGISYQIMRADGNPVKKQLIFQELRPLDFTLQDYSHAMNKLEYCSWIFEGSFVINHRGNLNLCCNCDVVPKHNLGSFLTQDISAIQLKRFLHPVCGRCTKGRASVNNNLNNIIAIKNVLKEGIEAQMLKNDLKLELFIENYNLKIISDYFLFNAINNMGEK